MATNQILPFATDDIGTNLLTQAEYAADAQRTIGHQPGIARSKLANKAMRQASLISAGLAQFIAAYQANNVTDGLTPQQIADYLVAALNAAVPVPVEVPPGAIMHFAWSVTPPGWLQANGAAVSRTTYSDLFTTIGTTFGAGNGSTTFNLPDLRGEFIRGRDNGRGVDPGRGLGTLQLDAFQGHGHDLLYAFTGAFGPGNLNTSLQTQLINGILKNFATDPIELGANGAPRVAKETRPRNVSFLACIKF
jgi:phage-related tail fiber protein